MSDTIDAQILLFDGFDELDAIGPYEVLRSAESAGEAIAVRLVTLEPTDTVTASFGLRIEPDGTLADPDLLVVPGGRWSDGGGVRREVDDGAMPAAIRACHEHGATVASVCTGAMLLVAAGLLDDRPAVTHHEALDDLEAVADVRDARVVDDGDVLTAGGVTSGLDLSLWLLEREFGEPVAERAARRMEYERRGGVVRTGSR